MNANLTDVVVAIREMVERNEADATDLLALADAYEEAGDSRRATFWRAVAASFGKSSGVFQTTLTANVTGQDYFRGVGRFAAEYGKRNLYIHVAYTKTCGDFYAEGGTKSFHWFVNDVGVSHAIVGGTSPWTGPQSISFDLKPGDGILTVGRFCGKPTNPRLTLHPLALEQWYV